MAIQLVFQEQFVVGSRTVFFQVFLSHPAVLAELHRLFRFKNEIAYYTSTVPGDLPLDFDDSIYPDGLELNSC